MKLKDKIIVSFLIGALFLAFFLLIKPILFPFIAALVIAYLFNPLAARLEKLKLSRTLSVVAIISIILIILEALLILVLPLLYDQMTSLINSIPKYAETFIKDVYPNFRQSALEHGFKLEYNLSNYFSGENIKDVFSYSGGIFDYFLKSGIVLVNIFSLIFITPVLVFYILRDWNSIVKSIDNHLPVGQKKNIRNIFSDMDKTLSSCIHGQFNVCVILGLFYSCGLTLTGLNFGFLIGFLTGFMSFIPYVGMLVGVVIAIIIALFQWGLDWFHIGIVSIVFILGQIIESNFLTPKLVGDKIGLHPVWVIFGLFVFGILFGFVGILLALPLTAIFGVLIKFALSQYRSKFVSN